MYQMRYGFQRRPFPPLPDTSCYYPATCHEYALARLLNAIGQDEGMLLLTGEAGTGKTLLCHCLLERLGANCITAFLTNSHVETRRDLLQAILYDLSLPYEVGTEQELRLRLTEYLLKNYREGRRTILMIDEAQHLGVDVLEEIRLLSNLEASRGKAIQVILIAQPWLRQTLTRPELSSLQQRLSVRTRLDVLPLEEAVDYLRHQLRIAGAQPEKVFSDEAFEVLGRGTGGVPRLLNQAGQLTLFLGSELGAEILDAEIVLEAMNQMGLDVVEACVSEGIGGDALGDGHFSDPMNDNESQVPEEKTSSEPGPESGEESSEKEPMRSYRLYDPPRRTA